MANFSDSLHRLWAMSTTGGEPQTLPSAATVTLPTVTVGPWVYDFTMVVSILSTIGSLLIVLTYSAFREVRTTSREILVYLSLADIGKNAMIIWGVADKDINDSETATCQVQAVVLIYCGIAEYLWTCALSLYLFVILVRNPGWGSKRCPNVIHAVCWSAGFVVALVAYLCGKTGIDAQATNTARWCIIRGASDEQMGGRGRYVLWSMVVGDGWNFLAIICTLVFYVLIKRHLYNEVSDVTALQYMRVDKCDASIAISNAA